MNPVSLSTSDIQAHRTRIGWVMLGVATLLVIAWLITIMSNWHYIVSSSILLSYLLGDILLVVPLCVASWVGLKDGKDWGGLIFLITTGALAFNGLHFGVYLIQENILS